MGFKKLFDQGDFAGICDAGAMAQSPEERLMLGIAYLRLKRSSEAEAIFEAINSEVFSLVKAEYYMAQIHLQRGESEKAGVCIDRYLAYYPDDDEARDLADGTLEGDDSLVDVASPGLAELYAGQGHYEKALDIYADLIFDQDEPQVRNKAEKVQNKFIVQTLESWIERIKTDEDSSC
ncbi:MAG: tetratricopeptide repeat protein [Thermodesulfobacteriota bacterium]|nr:tetratricopeptide repeat protein [Thermodesulfobacteriota bacterium]